MLSPKPLKALRPAKGYAEKIASLPYDVLSRSEAKNLASKSEMSFLHVTRAEIDLDDSVNVYDKSVYSKAKENLDNLIKQGYLVHDKEERYYIYRQQWGEHTQSGIVGLFSVDDYIEGRIKKHENTRKEKEDDRTNHILTTRAQTGPVFLTYPANQNFDEFLRDMQNYVAPLYDFTSEDGIRHSVVELDYFYNQYLNHDIGRLGCLYIADGHHRAASAMRASLALRDKTKIDTKSLSEYESLCEVKEECNYFVGVIFGDTQLKVLPYNRVVFDLNGNSEEEFLSRIKERFDVNDTEIKSPKKSKFISMYLNHKWFSLCPNSKVLPSKSEKGENLDVSILQNYLLSPILGIDDPRTSKRIDFIGGIRGTDELEKLVDSGKAAVAFSLFPVKVSNLMDIADAGEIMPPKSTWFEPKLRDGLFTHLI